MPTERYGISERNRELLDRLHRQAKGPITPASAASILSLDLPRARRVLAYFAARGWLSRVRQGLYTLVPLGASAPSEWREDPWVVAASIFDPCYIAGWSAAEYWHLTEQIFRDIVVITAQPVRTRMVDVQDTKFLLKRLAPEKQFGLKTVWRGATKVRVSDPSKTVVDLLDDPRLAGGTRSVAAILKTYHEGEHRDDELLLSYVERLGNRAIFKRLGYLSETLRLDCPELIVQCSTYKSSGLSKLDPSISSQGKTVRRWNLRVNVAIDSAGEN